MVRGSLPKRHSLLANNRKHSDSVPIAWESKHADDYVCGISPRITSWEGEMKFSKTVWLCLFAVVVFGGIAANPAVAGKVNMPKEGSFEFDFCQVSEARASTARMQDIPEPSYYCESARSVDIRRPHRPPRW
jgi:hypothetical protein